MAAKIVGICPAAGQGRRLGPVPGCKELFPVGFQAYDVGGQTAYYPKAISQYLIEGMVDAGAQEVFIILGQGKHDIMNFYGDGGRFGVRIAYLYQEQLNGMPFALDLPYEWLDDSITLFGMPDTLIEPSDAFARLLAAHIDREDDVTLGLFKTSRPQKFGMVELDQEHNIVYCIDKPDRTHLDYLWGLAVWNYRFTQLLHEFVSQSSAQGVTSEVVLSTVFSRAIALNFKVRGVPFEDGFYFDIGTADDLWLTMTHILKNKPIPGK